MSSVLDPSTLPVDDNINPYAFSIDLNGEWFLQKGKMIAYYGQMRFESVMAQSVGGLVAQHFSSPMYAGDWVVAAGNGKLVLGDRGFDINSFDLDDGNLTVRADNLLAFAPTLNLKQSIVPGFLTLLGTGKFLASSSGPVMFVEPPIRVDPQALVGWADCPAPSHHFDARWIQGIAGIAGSLFGRQSGEERQFDFTGAGTVLMQSSEDLLVGGNMYQQVQQQVDGLPTPDLHRLRSHIQQRLQ